MMIYEIYFERDFKENDLNVIQYINPIAVKDSNETKEIILDFYKWYQKPENLVRQKILLIETRSEKLVSLINQLV